MNVPTHPASHSADSAALDTRLSAALPHAADFSLAVPNDLRLGLARAWLWLALASLIGSGVLSILLVLSRTHYMQKYYRRSISDG